ncbi:MAG: hypothetical protein DRN15_05985 [Thermoprotei archaeon]|nr:MAG: hypothetical protein DRN15_05985 [Thermoprotei archaeon]RLF25019.1 MAG: hypothetical protein DRM97_02640 [Thermoprotei archaeon]
MRDIDHNIREALLILERFYELSQLSLLVAEQLFMMDQDTFRRRRVEAILLRKLVRKAYVKMIRGVSHERCHNEAL